MKEGLASVVAVVVGFADEFLRENDWEYLAEFFEHGHPPRRIPSISSLDLAVPCRMIIRSSAETISRVAILSPIAMRSRLVAA